MKIIPNYQYQLENKQQQSQICTIFFNMCIMYHLNN